MRHYGQHEKSWDQNMNPEGPERRKPALTHRQDRTLLPRDLSAICVGMLLRHDADLPVPPSSPLNA